MKKPIDSLKLSSAEWSKLQLDLDKRSQLVEEDQRQGAVRAPMCDGILALLRLLTEGSQAPHFRIRCRDISSTGLGFMHGHFIHPGTPVEVIFITKGRDGLIINGKVARASLIDKNVHELGVHFDEPIDLDEVVAMGMANEPPEQPEHVPPADEAETATVHDEVAASTEESDSAAAEKDADTTAVDTTKNDDGPSTNDPPTANAA